ncbi:hypothetical protein PILCRDRAFT_6532 [Piloderma croceum F 1598]|uniref:Glucose receptor Git3 N-terminal domain-containing protein n=1 Tax=Piloderma croceum (strain F 1598) TaxID=765440 RepID=A0A0C3FXJ8_PILCF|nr:hypothetical protein PILCRDRAFT_6532 [Piloderma croceum F 1598]
MSSENNFQPIDSNQKQALIVIVAFASLSVFAVAFVFLRAIWLIANPLRRSSRHAGSKEYAFFHTQLGHYAACLLGGNLFASAAGTVVGHWVILGGMHEGSICTAQAVLMQIGHWAVAYFTVTIAVHTCRSLVFRSPQKAWLGATVVVIGWLSAVAVGIAPLKMSNSGSSNHSAYGLDGFTCGIKRVDPVPEFLFHLLPIFLAASVSAVIYSLIYLVLRGTLVIRGGLKINLDPQQRWIGRYAFDEYHRFIRAVAKSMLWYPFAYILLLLPYSITKLLNLSGYPVAFGGQVFAETCAVMLGFVNVCLLYNTFRVLGPAFESRSLSSTSYDEVSGGPPEKKPNLQRASQANNQSLQPDSHFLADNNTTLSFPALTYQKSISDAGSDSSLRLLIPGRESYMAHSRSSSLRSSIADSIGRTITPVSEFNYAIIVEPESILQKSRVGISDTGLQRYDIPSSSAGSLGFPQLPRQTRLSVSRHSAVQTITSATPFKDQLPDVDLRNRTHAQAVSVSNISSSRRGSFGARLISASPEDTLVSSGGQAGHGYKSSFSANETLMSDQHVSTSAGTSKAQPAQSLPIVTVRVSSPTEYDVIDHTLSNEVRSRTETVAPGRLTSLAWATLVTDAATSNGSSRIVIPRNAASCDGNDSVSPVPHVLRPRTAASSKSVRNGIVDTANRRANSVSSIMSGDIDVKMRQGPSKQPALFNGSSTRGLGLAHAPSNAAEQYYIWTLLPPN